MLNENAITNSKATLLIQIFGQNAIGCFSMRYFNDCIIGKSAQIVNIIIAMVDLIPYYNECTKVQNAQRVVAL